MFFFVKCVLSEAEISYSASDQSLRRKYFIVQFECKRNSSNRASCICIHTSVNRPSQRKWLSVAKTFDVLRTSILIYDTVYLQDLFPTTKWRSRPIYPQSVDRNEMKWRLLVLEIMQLSGTRMINTWKYAYTYIICGE